MALQVESPLATLIARLDAAVDAGDPARVVHLVKDALESTLRAGGLDLPEQFRRPRADKYARRLLHRDPKGRYTAVVMIWGPGQGTSLHDHAGLWCVDCVVDGEIVVTQYDLTSESGDRYQFAPQSRVTASRGAAGCLIPPFEYHTITNRHPDAVSITLHVYGGEMTQCHVFEPAGDGTYRRVFRELSYDE